MTKLEEKALKAYPVIIKMGHVAEHDINLLTRRGFIKGYQQAIEDACEWLRKNCTYIHPRKGTDECVVNIPRFKTDLLTN